MTSADGPDGAVETAHTAHLALLGRGQTVGCAESLTGGELAAVLSRTPGASATFRGGVVTYATELKRSLLGVTAERVVSAECAAQMAAGARDLLGVDWALATTGVAGPDEQEGQPVGTVHVALAGPGATRSLRLELELELELGLELGLGGQRAAIRSATVEAAVRMLLEGVAADA